MSENKESRTIFHDILDKKIPSNKVYEDDYVYAFKDINPVAPFHVLIIPKNLNGLTSLSKAEEKHKELLGHMMYAVSLITKQNNIDSYRTVINSGEEAGQSVFYIHIHIIGGKSLSWPP